MPAGPAKAACSQLVAGTHLGRIKLAAAHFSSLEHHPLCHGQNAGVKASSIIFVLV